MTMNIIKVVRAYCVIGFRFSEQSNPSNNIYHMSLRLNFCACLEISRQQPDSGFVCAEISTSTEMKSLKVCSMHIRTLRKRLVKQASVHTNTPMCVCCKTMAQHLGYTILIHPCWY